MVVGILTVKLGIPGARSLKEKRKVVRSVKDRVKAKFNASIAEVANHDLHQTATLGVSVVSADAPHADSQLQKILSLINETALVSHVSTELLNINER
ncbi:hypothetical protein MNBD_NITROSPINAE01-515 [hydrothermal vent metagenome]|uniref:YlxP-like protein n=1 Tax=hydrothermal vent metagenome TaxID=652676 RepID=A0A3B1CEA4_9ZZZZ